ncbi:HAD family hydrolase [Bacillus sp. REN3]|uniref:HAD family hydrolase n=1 Tax=Bacillus sp. REN3 TaxID=2802440 RepID=UPI001AEED5D8|nr:HAD family hydrolase [Bacillus sp. REN3]
MSSFKAIIFDLDDTIINTSEIKHLRKQPWGECYSKIPSNTYLIFDSSLLNILNNQFIIGIVTNSPRPYASRVLSHHNFNFDDLICYHDCSKRKPHPDPMILSATRLGVNPNEVIAIGDHKNDILAAKSAGMTAIGVTWGESTTEELSIAGSDYLVDDVNQLRSLLEAILEEE